MASKVSIVTITLDDGRLLKENIRAVSRQTYPHIEQVVVDGGSTSVEPLCKSADRDIVYCRQSPSGVYSAINCGLRHTTGEVIGLVHGGDRLTSDEVIEQVIKMFDRDDSLDFIYGDVQFVKEDSNGDRRVTRHYSGARFEPRLLTWGFAPPHPSLFIRRRVLERVGFYKENYIICADFEMWVRLFNPELGLKWKYIPLTMVDMSPGGISAKIYNRIFVNTPEKRRALSENGISVSLLKLLRRYLFLS